MKKLQCFAGNIKPGNTIEQLDKTREKCLTFPGEYGNFMISYIDNCGDLVYICAVNFEKIREII